MQSGMIELMIAGVIMLVGSCSTVRFYPSAEMGLATGMLLHRCHKRNYS